MRTVLILLAVTLIASTASRAALARRPGEAPADYDHDRFITQPVDILYEDIAFVLSFDSKDDDDGDGQPDTLRTAHWVAQEVRRFEGDCIPTGPRPSPWFADPGLLAAGTAAADESYAYPTAFRDLHPNWFDRGHLAMKFLAERLGNDAAWNTHTTLNAVPQRAKFNRGIWQDLELTTGAWAQTYEQIWIIQGPVFLDDLPTG